MYNIVQNLSSEILYNRDFHTKNKIHPYLFHWENIVFKEKGPFILCFAFTYASNSIFGEKVLSLGAGRRGGARGQYLCYPRLPSL